MFSHSSMHTSASPEIALYVLLKSPNSPSRSLFNFNFIILYRQSFQSTEKLLSAAVCSLASFSLPPVEWMLLDDDARSSGSCSTTTGVSFPSAKRVLLCSFTMRSLTKTSSSFLLPSTTPPFTLSLYVFHYFLAPSCPHSRFSSIRIQTSQQHI